MQGEKAMLKLRKKQLTQIQTIAIGFLCIIFIGACLLTLPIANRSGKFLNFIDALFTATSASCVTGLVVADTYQNWTIFGQLVIITLIQIGGLGFMCIGVFFSVMLGRKIGLKERGILQESVNTLQIGGIVKLAKKIVYGTLLFEGIGAILLSIRFIPAVGVLEGIYYGVFHSISAFCNAGFDLMGQFESYSSLVMFHDDWIVNVTIMSLIVIGGLGFIVWDDISKKKWQFKKYMLHSKIVLVTTAILILLGAILFFFLEKDNTMKDMSMTGKILSSFFASVTPRTAGFNSIDVEAMHDSSKFLTVFLMFIGGSPGSTAGGIKTTTFVVIIVYIISTLKHTQGCNIFNRRLEDDAIKKASSVFCTNLFLAVTAAFIICGMQMFPLEDVLLEVFSAMGTVGMSTGLTRELNVISKLIVIMLMYCGRIGSLTFALSFTEHKTIVKIRQPVEKINIG